MAKTKLPEEFCSFCETPKSEAGSLVRGATDNVYICAECVASSKQSLDQLISNKKPKKLTLEQIRQKVPTPKTIVQYLDQYVIGQAEAKKSLAIAVHDHYLRIYSAHTDTDNDVQIDKSNILLVGPSGTGKTLLAKALATLLNVPFAIGDATSITEAGYVGEDVENLLLRLLHSADMDIALAEKGILYIDEIDKIRSTGGNVSITRDVSGEGVQQSLLKMIEGTICNVPPQGGRKHPEQQFLQIDTTDILFICGGSFAAGLENIIKKRIGGGSIGFGRDNKSDEEKQNDIFSQVTDQDLIDYGIIPELVGRLPVISTLKELSVDDLCHVLTEPKNALLRQQQKMFKLYGQELKFTDAAVAEIATRAKEKKTGARALRSIVETIMREFKFSMPDEKAGKSYSISDVFVKESLQNDAAA